jgi:peptidoglycan/LPS O-acetylase OafA/YrhL
VLLTTLSPTKYWILVIKYRAEIDGLRALAVVPVILFHAGFELFRGGFVGVDVFFVISGYLITTILIEDIEKNRFSFVNFYERRARRILPPLFFVMVVCVPFAWMWMLPSQIKEFSQSFIAVSLFASNILFWRESGYFAAAAEEKPLLHTWSLAVEEQYYLLFPIFLILAWRFGKNRVFWSIVIFAAISLALSEWGWRNQPSANFYLAPTRAWELFAGTIAAFIVQKHGIQANNTLSIIGLSAILFAIFGYDESIPFPSMYALVPVVGVMLLILFAKKETFVAKLLSTKAFVGIGLISYSAYLWHQPLFAFAKIRLFEGPSAIQMALLSLVSMILAFLSWKVIEQPFRNKVRVNRTTIFVISVMGMSLFICLGSYGYYKNGYVNSGIEVSPNLDWISIGERIKVEGSPCDRHKKLFSDDSPILGCEFGSNTGDKNIVLLGDSHSEAISYVLDNYANENNFRVHWLSLEGCEPVPSIRENKNLSIINCDARFGLLLNYIKSLNSNVIVINRWTFRMYPVLGYALDMPYKNSEGYEESESYRVYDVYKNGEFYRDAKSKADALTHFISKLSSVSNRLFLVYPVPETAIDIAKRNSRYWNENNELLNDITTPVTDYEERNKFVNSVFDNVQLTNVHKIKPKELFCERKGNGRCDMQIDGVPLYLDDDHLSDEGAKLIVDAFNIL